MSIDYKVKNAPKSKSGGKKYSSKKYSSKKDYNSGKSSAKK